MILLRILGLSRADFYCLILNLMDFDISHVGSCTVVANSRYFDQSSLHALDWTVFQSSN